MSEGSSLILLSLMRRNIPPGEHLLGLEKDLSVFTDPCSKQNDFKCSKLIDSLLFLLNSVLTVLWFVGVYATPNRPL